MRQQSLKLPLEFQARKEHGGVQTGKRKISRPFDSRLAIHIVLRSKKATGALSMLRCKYEPKVSKLVYGLSKRFRIEICEFANAGNHLHLLVRTRSVSSSRARVDFQNFLRTLSALVARLVAQAKKGKPFGSFWDSLAYTRIVSLGREFSVVARYILLSKLEGWGIIPTQNRGSSRIFSYIELLALVPIDNANVDTGFRGT